MTRHIDKPRDEFGFSYVPPFFAVALLQLRKMEGNLDVMIGTAAWIWLRPIRGLAALALFLSLAACGFQLRGQASLPFDTLYVPGSSPLVVELRRNVTAGTHSKIVPSEKDAKAILGFTSEAREKVILSFNTSGLVREYQLRYRVGFRLYDAKGRNYIAPSEIQLTRDVTFNESQVLAKETEDALLYRDMQSDMVQQIIRRIVTAKVPTDEAVE
jgi:LPS-assembly lipoprotein